VCSLAADVDDIVCYEEASAIGGNWVYDDAPDRRSVYRATRLISSKRLSEFEDFPMPDDYPDFPSHQQMLDYFEAYAAHFNLPAKIVLKARVEAQAVCPTAAGRSPWQAPRESASRRSIT
jgi:cation diffusion facilitator CzcD-associated flavoprotein CzcO